MVLSIFNVLERIGVRWGKLSSILLTVSQGICRGCVCQPDICYYPSTGREPRSEALRTWPVALATFPPGCATGLEFSILLLITTASPVSTCYIHHSMNTGAYEYSLKHYKSFGGQRDVFYHRYSIRILRVV